MIRSVVPFPGRRTTVFGNFVERCHREKSGKDSRDESFGEDTNDGVLKTWRNSGTPVEKPREGSL